MARIGENMNELNAQATQARFDFLITDAETALTMLDLADTTNSPENRRRRRKAAEQAYRAIVNFVPKSQLSFTQLEALNQKLSRIRVRLAS
jgi:hypothetical protein